MRSKLSLVVVILIVLAGGLLQAQGTSQDLPLTQWSHELWSDLTYGQQIILTAGIMIGTQQTLQEMLIHGVDETLRRYIYDISVDGESVGGVAEKITRVYNLTQQLRSLPLGRVVLFRTALLGKETQDWLPHDIQQLVNEVPPLRKQQPEEGKIPGSTLPTKPPTKR